MQAASLRDPVAQACVTHHLQLRLHFAPYAPGHPRATDLHFRRIAEVENETLVGQVFVRTVTLTPMEKLSSIILCFGVRQ